MSRLGLNLPNLISLGRLLLVPLAISLILEGSYWAAFWVFVIAGASDALDGFIAKRFDRRTRLGALLDPLADKVLLVSVYVTLGIAGQIMGLAGRPGRVSRRDDHRRLLADPGARRAPKPFHPLFISKVNTGVQVALCRLCAGAARARLRFRPGRRGFGHCRRADDTAVGLTYLVRWARILGRSEQAL